MTSELMQNKDYHTLFDCLACTANDGCTVRISSAAYLITILSNFGGYKTFRPWLTKYCRGCVPGIPGGVDWTPPGNSVGAY